MVVYNLCRARVYSVSGAHFQDPAKYRESLMSTWMKMKTSCMHDVYFVSFSFQWTSKLDVRY